MGFLGNKMISQVATLGFLAVWHGFHAGYYTTFFNEFVTVMVERQFLSIWGKSSKVGVWRSHPAYTTITSVLGWIWVWVFLPHAFIPFSLLLWSASLQAYASTYFFMYIAYAAWFLFLKGALKQALGGQPKEKVDAQVEDTRRVETVEDKKEQVMDDQTGENASEDIDSTNNLDLPNNDDADVSENNDQSQNDIVEADVVESLIEHKPSVMN